ncbi:hypothetical protein AB0D34_10810 [Streptomyces sp. NPDC048420]|uniref:hypothetical protein n=1 Tax=Streptomyces sp. NPDC048420 TaxID=3155755 RepID=UPI00344877F2
MIHDLATDNAVVTVKAADSCTAGLRRRPWPTTPPGALTVVPLGWFRQQALFMCESTAPQLQRMEHSA